jgi:HEAT repeat protein
VSRILDDGTFDLSLRLVIAQQIVMVATNPLNRPEPFNRTWPGGAEGPPEGKERIARAQKAKAQAIAVLVEALRSDNSLYRKAAVYSLSLCGPEAEMALPELKEVMAADKDGEILRYAGAAVQRIGPGGASVGGQRDRGGE